MDKVKLGRLESLALRELSLWLVTQSKDDALRNISVSAVKITNDLSYMTIYFTSYQQDVKTSLEVLDNNKVLIRKTLASKIKARKMPDLIFKYDDSLNRGNHIEDLLKKISE